MKHKTNVGRVAGEITGLGTVSVRRSAEEHRHAALVVVTTALEQQWTRDEMIQVLDMLGLRHTGRERQ